MEQLQNMQTADLAQRGHLRVAERAVRPLDHVFQIGAGQFASEEREHLQGKVLIRKRLPSVEQSWFDRRQAFRQEQAAVARQAHHHGLVKRNRRNAAACADVVHLNWKRNMLIIRSFFLYLRVLMAVSRPIQAPDQICFGRVAGAQAVCRIFPCPPGCVPYARFQGPARLIARGILRLR